MGGGTPNPIPPIGVISATNQSGLILILTGLSLSFVLVSFAIRVFIRHPKGLWKLDDNILTAATLLACAQSAIIVRGVDAGLGDKDRETLDIVLKYYFSNHYLYIIELFLSKAAVAALYLRLTAARQHRIAIWSLVGTCVGWLLLSIILISTSFSWTSAFVIPFPRWLAVGVLDMVTEVGLCLMSVYLVKDLQLRMERKINVVSAFCARLCTLVPCAVRLYYLEPSTLDSNRTLATSLAIVAGQLQLGIAIMSASVAVLKPFMVVYDKSTVSADYTTRASRGSHGGAFNYTPEKGHAKNQSWPSHISQNVSAASHTTTNSYNSHKSKLDSRRNQASFALQSLKSNLSIRSNRSDGGALTQTSTVVSTSTNSNSNNPFAGSSRSTRIITSGRFPSLIEDMEALKATEGRTSQESGDSDKKMIINRRDEWSIKYEDAEPGCGPGDLETGHAHGHQPCLHRAMGMGPSVNGKGVGFGANTATTIDDLELGPMLTADEPGPKDETEPSCSTRENVMHFSAAEQDSQSSSDNAVTLKKNSISSHDYATSTHASSSGVPATSEAELDLAIGTAR